MSQANLVQWLKEIQRIRPAIIQGYTTALVALAEANEKTGLAANQLGIKAVIISAEVLFPWQRELLERVFGCRVFNRYGSRELSTIAHECKFGRLHINEDWLYLEVVDDRGLPVPAGNLGQIVLTGFFNLGMPFIRYAIDDVGALPVKDEACPCGCTFRTLEKLEGRVQDLISLPGGGYLSSALFPHLFKDFDIRQFQVIQPALDRLDIFLSPGDHFDNAALEKVRIIVMKYTPGIEAVYHLVDEIPTATSGKRRIVISHVTRANVFRSEA
jgi:phenylacetate-CoA ligase